MAALISVRNIGNQSAQWLEAVGSHTSEQLFNIGAVQAYLSVKSAFPERVSLTLLYALPDALIDIPWKLPSEIKTSLIKQVQDEDWCCLGRIPASKYHFRIDQDYSAS